MPTYVPPKKATQLIFYVGLVDSANRPVFKSNPTLASGDVKFVLDDSAPANLNTLPTVISSGKVVKVTLSTSETNGDNVAVIFSDQTSPSEWDDVIIGVQTSAHQMDDMPQANIKKNTALSKFAFLMTDSTNHAPMTGLTVTCTRSIDGASFAAGTLANIAEVGNGIYTVDFLAADLNGTVIVLRATATGADDTTVTFVTTL